MADAEATATLLPPHIWEQATGFHLLRLLKLLSVEQQSVATLLDVTWSSVSMWCNGHRPVPPKYRPRLLEYARTMLPQAARRVRKEAEGLPAPLHTAAVNVFQDLVIQWGLEVLHEKGILHARLQEECRRIGTYADHATMTAQDRKTLRQLCFLVRSSVQILDELEAMDDKEADRVIARQQCMVEQEQKRDA